MNNYSKLAFALVLLSFLTSACTQAFREEAKRKVAENERYSQELKRKRAAKKEDPEAQRAAAQQQPTKLSPGKLAALKLLEGALKGSTCNGNISVEVNIVEDNIAEEDIHYGWLTASNIAQNDLLVVRGSFRSVVVSGQPNGTVIETPLKGVFHHSGAFRGFLHLQAVARFRDSIHSIHHYCCGYS